MWMERDFQSWIQTCFRIDFKNMQSDYFKDCWQANRNCSPQSLGILKGITIDIWREVPKFGDQVGF